MLRGGYIFFILLILLYLKPCESLPPWVHRVDSCPDPNDIRQWIKASTRLNCLHDLTSTDPNEQANVYHCLPTAFVNETVEFCSRNVPVAPGNCPVYNYKFGPNVQATYYNCSSFTSGCPAHMFHSKNVFKYQECLRINKKEKCYEATKNCSLNTRPDLTTEKIPQEQTSTRTTIDGNLDSVKVQKMLEKEDNNKRITYIAVGVILPIILIMVGLYLYLLYKKKLFTCKTFFHKGTNSSNISEEELASLRSINCNQRQNGSSDSLPDSNSDDSQQQSESHSNNSDDSGLGQSELEERRSLLKNIHKGATNWCYNDLLAKLKKKMSSKMIVRIKDRLEERKENGETDLAAIKTSKDLLDYLDKKYLAFHNVIFLQGLFLASNAPELYNICTDYAKGKEKKITYFEETILEKDHTKVTYKINCPDMSHYPRADLEELRESVALLTNAQFDDVLVCGVRNGCVIVTFMIRNCLIPTLRAFYLSEKQTMAFHGELKHKIINVTIKDDVLYMPDRLLSVDGLISEAELGRNMTPLPAETNGEMSATHSEDLLDHGNLDETKDVQHSIKDYAMNTDLETNEHIESPIFKDYLQKSFCSMTDDTFTFMKMVVQDVMDEKSIEMIDKASLLNKMSDTIHLQHNMEYLEWIFEKCGETDLVDTCHTFLKGSNYQPEGFQTKLSPRCGYQALEFHFTIHVLEPDAFKIQMQDLRKWIADIISVHPGKILMTGLEVSPIILTYMMTKEQAGVFLRFLQTDDGQIQTFRKRVEKVITEGKIFTTAKAINGRHYVHIHFRCPNNSSGLKGKLQYASMKVVQALGIKREGPEIYTSIVLSDNQKTDKHEEPGDTKNFIEKNRDHLLRNLEPQALLRNHGFTSCFDHDEIAKIHFYKSRQEKVEHLLTMCTKLPTGEIEKVLPYLEESVPSHKTIRSDAELDSVRNWIQENRLKLLEEIDSNFIETTLDDMKGVCRNDRALWLDGSKSRKERAKHFLDAVFQNDENVMVFKERAIAEFDLAD